MVMAMVYIFNMLKIFKKVFLFIAFVLMKSLMSDRFCTFCISCKNCLLGFMFCVLSYSHQKVGALWHGASLFIVFPRYVVKQLFQCCKIYFYLYFFSISEHFSWTCSSTAPSIRVDFFYSVFLVSGRPNFDLRQDRKII